MATDCARGDEKKDVCQESGQNNGEYNRSAWDMNSGLEAFEDHIEDDQYKPGMSDGQFLPESGRQALAEMIMELLQDSAANHIQIPKIEVCDWDPEPSTYALELRDELCRFSYDFLHAVWRPRATEECEAREECNEWDLDELGNVQEEDFQAIEEDMGKEEFKVDLLSADSVCIPRFTFEN